MNHQNLSSQTPLDRQVFHQKLQGIRNIKDMVAINCELLKFEISYLDCQISEIKHAVIIKINHLNPTNIMETSPSNLGV